DCKYIHVPFPTYEIRLPKESPFRETDTSPILRSLLVAREENDSGHSHKDGRDWTLCVHYQFDLDISLDYMGWFFKMPMRAGVKVEDQINDTLKKNVMY